MLALATQIETIGRLHAKLDRDTHALDSLKSRSFAPPAISGRKAYFGCTFGSPPGVPGGGMILR